MTDSFQQPRAACPVLRRPPGELEPLDRPHGQHDASAPVRCEPHHLILGT